MPIYEINKFGDKNALVVVAENVSDAAQAWVEARGLTDSTLKPFSGSSWLLSSGDDHFVINEATVLLSERAKEIKEGLISLVDGEDDSLADILNPAIRLLP